MTNKVTIDISGYGGEFVLGEITKEQHEYWTTLGDDAIEEYCQDAFDYVDENRIPEDMDFLDGNGWYDCDNIDHIYGCDLESSWIEITLDNDETVTYDNAYDIRNKYEEEDNFDDIGKDYCLEDEMIREDRECYTSEGHNFCYDKGHYFTAYASEKGQFIWTEFELPEGHKFDERRLVFNTIDLDGSDFLNSISYIFPDDKPDDPTELDNQGGSTNGKGWECNLFEITRPDEEKK
jgi:regulator of sigma D